MARNGLAMKLRGAIREASKGTSSVTVDAHIWHGKTARTVAMTVMPLPASSRDSSFLLVSFAPAVPASDPVRRDRRDATAETSASEQALQDVLISTRAELLNTIEHLETANEELQSTNEELEISKEELQSFNEELITVNNQLQHKIGELEAASNELTNLLAGSATATLFLDGKFCIRWFAPATRELFDLVSTDIGRPIAHFARKFAD